MYRASTPTHRFGIPMSRESIADFLLTYADANTGEIIVEFTMKNAKFDDEHYFTVTLTQEQTNKFSTGIAEVQLRVKGKNGRVVPSKVRYLDVHKVLNDEVL